MSVHPTRVVRRPVTYMMMCSYDHRLVRVSARSVDSSSTQGAPETSQHSAVYDQGRAFCNTGCFSHYCDLQDRCAGDFV